ncbi:MAG: DUF4123 domain-containing protein [Flavobacteriales bacterium]
MHILIDGARTESNLIPLLSVNPNNASLYKGRSEEALSDFAPYLFTLEPKTDFSKFYFEKGWGDAWGILVQSNSTFDDLYKHFRKFLIVKTEEGKELYFRFYDPRVLRIFLPTCDKQQLIEFFGPVKQYILEDEDAQFAIRFWLENGELRNERIHVRDWNMYEKSVVDLNKPIKPVAITNQPGDDIKKTITGSSWID